MIAQARPDIANVTEHTVIALKELESRIGVLKGDLAALCQNLGHPEAARVAAAPSPGQFGLQAPWLAQSAWANPAAVGGLAIGAPGFAPNAAPGFAPNLAAYASPYGAPYAAPFGSFSAYGAYAPASAAYVHTAYAPAAPWATQAWASPLAYATPAAGAFASPFASVPAGYR